MTYYYAIDLASEAYTTAGDLREAAAEIPWAHEQDRMIEVADELASIADGLIKRKWGHIHQPEVLAALHSLLVEAGETPDWLPEDIEGLM